MRLGRNLAPDQNDRPRTRLRPGGRLSSGPAVPGQRRNARSQRAKSGRLSPANPTTRRPRPGPRNADDHESRGCRHARPQQSRGRCGRHRAARARGSPPRNASRRRDRPPVGLGGGAGLFSDLDRDASAAIGSDLDAVRARVQASFGTEALIHSTNAARPRPRLSRLNPRRAIPPGLLCRRRLLGHRACAPRDVLRGE
jgi:hypothetical protein